MNVNFKESVILKEALRIGRRFHFEEEHGYHVARIALSLYDQLHYLHKLADYNRRLLLAASILHDIGDYVACDRHNEHSLTLILTSIIPNLAPREILIIANTARYHRGCEPDLKHEYFASLSENEQERVRRLASVLRMADGIDKGHLQRVLEVVR